MCGSFFNFSERTLKIAYRILSVVVAAFVVSFALAFTYYWAVRTYYPIKYQTEIKQYGKEFNLDDALVLSVIRIESGFDENAESKKGAKGLMQITDETGKYISEKLKTPEYDLKDAKTNIYFGCYYLRYLFDRFVNLETVLAAYNAGEGNVAEWLKDERYSNDNKTLMSIPYRETREYVKKIKKTFRKYNKLYENILDKRQNFE